MWKKQWRDLVTLIAGIWLAASPWGLGHPDEATRVMLYNAVVVGLAMALLSIANFAKEDWWQPILSLVLGLWAVASPFVLGFTAVRAMMFSTIGVGVVVAVVSFWQVVDRYDRTDRLLQ